MKDSDHTEWQPLDLGGGATAYLEVTPRGRQEVGALDMIPFDQVVQTLTRIAQGLGTAVEAVRPSKASIEIGVEFGLEAGQVVALIARGTGKANLKITLEWDQR
jgi:hypothetical protein